MKKSLFFITARHFFCILVIHFLKLLKFFIRSHSLRVAIKRLISFVINLKYRLIAVLKAFHMYSSTFKSEKLDDQSKISISC